MTTYKVVATQQEIPFLQTKTFYMYATINNINGKYLILENV